jgi:hypothetical protein
MRGVVRRKARDRVARENSWAARRPPRRKAMELHRLLASSRGRPMEIDLLLAKGRVFIIILIYKFW